MSGRDSAGASKLALADAKLQASRLETQLDKAKQEIALLKRAIEPLADMFLWPDDTEMDQHTMVMSGVVVDDEVLDDKWVKRAWIRAARRALGRPGY